MTRLHRFLCQSTADPDEPLWAAVDKARAMIEAGVRSCWIAQPSIQTVRLFDDELRPRTFTEGSFEDAATGIEIDVVDVFASVRLMPVRVFVFLG